jgi:GH15 family glucan-1,4-alpha-glucosidase
MPPIEDYGLIGDTRTAALVSSDGAIDWLCVPRFDGDPVFGRLIGGADAGTFRVGPRQAIPLVARQYRPRTATIETTWRSQSGTLRLVDGMVTDVEGRLLPTTLLVRRLSAEGGTVEATVEFDPRLGRVHRRPRTVRRGDLVVCSWGGGAAMSLRSDAPEMIEPGRPVTVTISPHRPVTLVVAVADREPLIDVQPESAWHALLGDERVWAEWCAGVDADLPCREAVVRSLVTLRLLEHSPSGAPVAAVTTSLPEQIGGNRNWDYRYAWPRDASIGVGAFLGLGKVDEARHFLAWLLHASRLDRPRLPVLLSLHGRHPAGEEEWTDWPGYAGSTPVRIGNGADTQHQLDGYGWVIDAAWLLTAAGQHLCGETWRAVRGFANEVAGRWREADAGIWEVRGPQQHHVHSKLMGWLALDRAIRIATHHRTPARLLDRWHAERLALQSDVMTKGFDELRCTYTRTYGSDDLDAALLVLPLIGIEPANSPRVLGTVEAIRRELSAGGPWLYRYPPGSDGLAGTEGAFVPCAFWLAQALAGTGRAEEAGALLEQLTSRASSLGLYGEQVDPATGATLGNFPQALSHSALVQASLALAHSDRS